MNVPPDGLPLHAHDVLLDPLEALDAVRDDAGRIVDYRIRYANQAMADAVGRSVGDLVGALVGDAFPAMDPTLRARWDSVVETGRPLVGDGVTMYCVVQERDRRFDLRGVRFGDGLVYTYRDVTDRFETTESLRASERLYRLLAENTSDVVYVVDGDLIRWVSPSCFENLGWTSDELAGRRWDTIIHAGDLAAAAELQARARPGQRVRGRARYRTRDGSVHWTDLVLGVLRDDDGNPEATLVSARNIDAEVAAEEAAAETRRQQDRLIAQLPVGVFRARAVVGGVSRLEFVSPRCAELLRSPTRDLDVRAVVAAIEPADVRRLYEAGARAAATDGQLSCDVRLAGVVPTVWLRIRANLELVPGGELAAGGELVIDGTVADVTRDRADAERLAREAEASAARAEHLSARAEQLSGVDRARTALLAALGHDLRTPLAVVTAAASGMRGEGLTDGQRAELLGNIEASAASLGSMLNDLLDASRVETGSLPVRLAPLALVEALEEPLRNVSRGVRLDLPVDLPDVVADRGLLERVLDNLLRNAVRHQVAGTPVVLAARADDEGWVRIEVRQQGAGVAVERHEALFVPFRRVADSGPDGLGLGLWIARAFAEAMGGRLTPSETPGGGLTMTITLPAAVPQLAEGLG